MERLVFCARELWCVLQKKRMGGGRTFGIYCVVWIWKATGQIAISLVLEARTTVPLQRYTKDVWRRWTYLYVEALKDLGGCDKKLFLQSLLVFSWNLTPVHAKARASARGTVRALSDFWQLRLKIMLRYWMLRMMYLRVGRGSRVDRFFNVPCNLLSCRLNLYLLAVAGCVTTWKVHIYQEGSVYSNKPNMLRMPYAVCQWICAISFQPLGLRWFCLPIHATIHKLPPKKLKECGEISCKNTCAENPPPGCLCQRICEFASMN